MLYDDDRTGAPFEPIGPDDETWEDLDRTSREMDAFRRERDDDNKRQQNR